MKNLTELATQYDKGEMYATYASWPKMLEQSYSAISIAEVPREAPIAFAGIGGSASAPEIIADCITRERAVEVSVIKDVELPPRITSRYVIVCVSARGNTEEILLLAKRAVSRGYEVIGVSSGGRLESFCREEGLVHVKIPYEHSPRASFPYILVGCLKVAEAFGLVKDVRLLLEDIRKIWSEVLHDGGIRAGPDALPIRVANHIRKKLPMCFSTPSCIAVARRFKNSFNENVKRPMVINFLPEAAHNEMEPVLSSGKTAPLLLSLGIDDNATHRIIEAVEHMFNKKNIEFLRINGVAEPRMSALLQMLYTLELASYYCAIMLGVDPSPVPASDSYRACLGTLSSLDT